MKTLKTVWILLLCLSLAVCAVACASSKPEPTEEPLVGGWSSGDPTELTAEQKELFEKAMATMVGVDYTPVLYLGSQIVAGRNHRFLCQAQVVFPDAPLTWAIVEIYEDLEGNAEVTNVTDLTAEEAAQYGV